MKIKIIHFSIIFLYLFHFAYASAVLSKISDIPQYWKNGDWMKNISKNMPRNWLSYLNKTLEISLINSMHENLSPVDSYLKSIFLDIHHHLIYTKTCRIFQSKEKLVLSRICLGWDEIKPFTSALLKNNLIIDILSVYKMNVTFVLFELSSARQCLNPSTDSIAMVEYLQIKQSNTIEEEQCKKNRKTECSPKQYYKKYPPRGLYHPPSYEEFRKNCFTKHCAKHKGIELMCGKYPGHSRYYEHKTTHFNYSIWPPFGSKIEIVFQVFDTWLIKNYKVSYTLISERASFTTLEYGCNCINQHRTLNDRYFTCHCLTTSLMLPTSNIFIYRIISYRINVLRFRFTSSSKISIFDGPDTLSKILKFNNISKESIIASSFQALVLSSESADFGLKYTSHEPSNVYEIELDSMNPIDSLRLPMHDCTNTHVIFCVIKVKVVKNYQINITIQNIEYDGPSMLREPCFYGSLTTYHYYKWYGKTVGDISDTLCYNVSTNPRTDNSDPIFMFPIITAGTEYIHLHTWISFIYYKPYTSMKAEVSLKTTNCDTKLQYASKHYFCKRSIYYQRKE